MRDSPSSPRLPQHAGHRKRPFEEGTVERNVICHATQVDVDYWADPDLNVRRKSGEQEFHLFGFGAKSPYTQKDGPKHAMKESSRDATTYTAHLLVPMFRLVW